MSDGHKNFFSDIIQDDEASPGSVLINKIFIG